jgi:hypothetical protein
MRVFTLAVFAAVAFGALRSLTAVVQAPAGDPSAIIAAAREALGGEARLSGVKTFTVTGRTRQIQGNNLVPIEFEITCELPARCIRRDEIPARESGPTTIGFSGDDLIQLPVPAAMTGRGPLPAQLAALRINTTKQDFARLWLGMFAGSFSTFPVALTRIGEAEAPQGRADVVEVKGPGDFLARLFIGKDSHLPIMISWQGQAAGKPAEQRVYYADYRDVDGFRFPYRLRRAVGAETTEETTIDRYRINPRIDPRRFEGRP